MKKTLTKQNIPKFIQDMVEGMSVTYADDIVRLFGKEAIGKFSMLIQREDGRKVDIIFKILPAEVKTVKKKAKASVKKPVAKKVKK